MLVEVEVVDRIASRPSFVLPGNNGDDGVAEKGGVVRAVEALLLRRLLFLTVAVTVGVVAIPCVAR